MWFHCTDLLLPGEASIAESIYNTARVEQGRLPCNTSYAIELK